MRNESARVMEALSEALEIGREARVPVVISHHKTAGRSNWGRSVETLDRIRQARASGQAVVLDVYPYIASSTYLALVVAPRHDPFGPHRVHGGPEGAGVPGPPQATDRRRGERRGRPRIGRIRGDPRLGVPKAPGIRGPLCSPTGRGPGPRPAGCAPGSVGGGGRAVQAIYFSMAEEDVARILADRHGMIGSDGLPAFGPSRVHPRFFGTFPRILARYVRQDGVLTLEEAVRKMTSLPATVYGLETKGRLEVGLDADLVVFDPTTIQDTATFVEPDQAPEGIPYVWVGGRLAVEDGRVTERPGGGS